MVWTRQQQAVVAVLPKISAFMSMLGSGWIITEIVTHKGHHADLSGTKSSASDRRQQQPKLHHPYHRLLLAMCIYDFMEAIWNFQSTWPIPETPLRIWSTGTQATCSAQGFFLMLVIAVPIYNACLAVYYMLVIVFRFTETTLVTRVEPCMHLIAGGFGFGTAITMLVMGYYNDANLWCWIAASPPGCLDSWHFGYPPENENPCTRGDLAWIFRWAFYFAPLWLCILVATAATIAVYCNVYRNERRTLKYRRPETSQSNISQSLIFTQSMIDRRSTSRLSNEDFTEDVQLVQQQLKDIAQEEEEEDDILMGKRSATTGHEQVPTSPSVPTTFTSQNNNHGDGPNNDSNNAPADRRGEFTRNKSTLGQSMALIGQWREKRAEEMKYNPRTAQVARQSFYYLATFYMCHVWSTSNRIYQQKNGVTLFPLTVIHSFFDPLHGFLNFLVYQRPRYLVVRKKHPEIGRIGAIRSVLYFSFQQNQKQDKVATIAKTKKQEASGGDIALTELRSTTNRINDNDASSEVQQDEKNTNDDDVSGGSKLEYIERELNVHFASDGQTRSKRPSTIDEGIGEDSATTLDANKSNEDGSCAMSYGEK